MWNLSEELMKVWIGIFHFYSRDEVAKFYLYVGGAYTYPFEMIMSITSLPKAIFSRIRVPMCAYALIHMRYASTTCQGLHTRPHNLSFSTASVSHLSRSLTLLPPLPLSSSHPLLRISVQILLNWFSFDYFSIVFPCLKVKFTLKELSDVVTCQEKRVRVT